MSLGRSLKIFFTNQVKCDKCGSVIIDGTGPKAPQYDGFGNYLHASSSGIEGIGFLDNIIYGSKKEVLCDFCKNTERIKKDYDKQMEEMMKRPEIKRELDLERENLELNNRLLKQQLEALSNERKYAPVENKPHTHSGRAANFCSGCGNALKQNAQFCTKCGQKVG